MVSWTGQVEIQQTLCEHHTHTVTEFRHHKVPFSLKENLLCPHRFDPEFICNASDNSGRYSYQAQPAICRWNLVKLAEALEPELPPERAKEVIEEYLSLYNGFYLQNMRKKLGLLKKEEPEDELLVTELLQTMHNTGGVAVGGYRTSVLNTVEVIPIPLLAT